MQKVIAVSFCLLFIAALAACAPDSEPETGTITGNVFIDCDQDGECDCDDIGFADVSIQIFREQCAGVPLQTIDTADDGTFQFTGLEPGEYCVMSNLKPNCGGYFPTTTITQEVVLEPGQELQLESFGYTEMGQ